MDAVLGQFNDSRERFDAHSSAASLPPLSPSSSAASTSSSSASNSLINPPTPPPSANESRDSGIESPSKEQLLLDGLIDVKPRAAAAKPSVKAIVVDGDQGDDDDDTPYCICNRKPSDENDEDTDIMIECEVCHDWLHGKCVNLNTRLIEDIAEYVCPRCETSDTKTKLKLRHNYHRHDYSEQNADRKPVQAGTPVFIERLLKREFPSALENNVVCKLDHGSQLTVEYLEQNGFKRPLLVERKDGLQCCIPDADQINLSQIEDIVGGDYVIDVIDVERQLTFPMSIKELNEYFKHTPRNKVYNLISFEISKTKLTEEITAPRIVYDISWVSNGVWPDETTTEASVAAASSKAASATTSAAAAASRAEYVAKPDVQKYCLISAANSYTDFHIDFGGSSVWYHAVKGDKVFYLIEPTDENLKIYEKWNSSKNPSEVFLGDLVKKCYRFDIKAGNTIFLPSGWIHAVYTPHDSLVFGGNFLQSFSIPLQIKIYEIERRVNTPEKYRFPAFETLQWYAGKYFLAALRATNAAGRATKPSLLADLKHLNNTLKKWVASKEFYAEHDYQIPRKINYNKLLKSLTNEIVKAEAICKVRGEPSLRGLKRPTSSSHTSTSTPLSAAKKRSMFIDGSNDSSSAEPAGHEAAAATVGQLREAARKPVKQLEVINDMGDIQALEIGLDESELVDDPHATVSALLAKPEATTNGSHGNAAPPEQQPIRLVMKLPKAPAVAEPKEEPAAEPVVKPLKLKLKLPPNPQTGDAEIIQVDKSVAKSASRSRASSHRNNEDDELIKDLKNAYVDNDYVYPNVSDRSVRRSSSKAEPDSAEANPNGREKSTRKRKLKPYAVEYLTPKQFKGDQEAEEAAESGELQNGEPQPSQSSVEASPGVKAKKPRNKLEAMIEKNLKPTTAEKPVREKKPKAASKKAAEKDKDYVKDEEEDDEDLDFKINCKQNLKLSKKLKKTIAKQQQKEADESGSNGDSSTEAKSAASKTASALAADKQKKQNQKKAKKGFATTKQRLSKLLKLNRVINI